MNHKSRTILALIVGTFLLSACQNIAPLTSGIGSNQITPEQAFSEHLQIDNKQLGSKLYISDIKSRTNNDLLQVNAILTSTYKKSLQLQYQFQWFDQDGFAIEVGKSPWKAFELHGMQTATAAGLAPSTNASSFSIYVREVPEKFFKF
ncbi:YcfL family protein [Colwellia sp. 20A7]|uniref:YcfL family protein n=1 Tax=Colwellia sp. 20A7 TaxID=2689569 RepID=UPI001358D5DE|nr:YcfL family protein [Colwellia sp. 20A7]